MKKVLQKDQNPFLYFVKSIFHIHSSKQFVEKTIFYFITTKNKSKTNKIKFK